MFVDLPLEQLRSEPPVVAIPADFDDFWAGQLASARAIGADRAVTVRPMLTALATVDVYDVTFPGHDAAPIRAWLLMPQNAPDDKPVVVEFVGYNGGRGDPLDWLHWSACGYPHVVMDSRGQGGGWRTADTADVGWYGEPGALGFMARGINNPHHHYYTRLMVDAARLVDAVQAEPLTAGRRIITAGGSQGGALAIAAAHLADNVATCLPDVTFLSHIQRAVAITDAHPYGELAAYLRLHPGDTAQLFATFGYLDVANHALKVHAPGLFSVGLRDEIAPPSTVFAAYHQYAGRKNISVYPFAGHEGGGVAHRRAQLEFLHGVFG